MSRPVRLPWRVWISGASSGIGAEIARQVAAQGSSVALFARREERLRALRDEIVAARADARVLVQPGDVTSRQAVHEAVREAEEQLGGLDVLILNAGFGDTFLAEEFDASLVESMTAVNFLGAVYAIEAALPAMLARGSGTIVGVSSIAGSRGLPAAAAYCATKAALSTFLESLRIDLRPRGIRVITVSPGFIDTPLTRRNRFPMPFLQPVDRAAERIVDGIERGVREIHFPRRLTVPMKLLRCLPRPLYDALLGRLARRGYRKRPAKSSAD